MATPTPYDQASRYLVKLSPHSTLAWLMQESQDNFRFHGWVDRTVSERLGYPDKMSDTVAILERLDVIESAWLGVTEYQASPDSDMVFRVRDYTNNLAWKCRPPNFNPKDHYNVGAIVINLTGFQEVPPSAQWKQAGFLNHTEHRIVNIETLNADTIMQGILSGSIPVSLLGFIPLMQNGCTPAIIEQWKARTMLIDDREVRSDFARIVITLSELVDKSPIWATALEDWNMVESKYWNDQNAIAVAKSKLGDAREVLIELLVERFGNSSTHETLINQITDLARLRRMRRVVLTATSWDAVTSIE